MSERIFISFGKNGLGQYQASIEIQHSDGGSHGYRIAGAKYDGMGTELFRAELDERDAREIRGYLDRLDPDELARLRAREAELVEALEAAIDLSDRVTVCSSRRSAEAQAVYDKCVAAVARAKEQKP